MAGAAGERRENAAAVGSASWLIGHYNPCVIQILPGPPTLPFHQLAREVRERLEAAVRSHLMSDVPVGVFLSGESIPAPWQPR